MSEDQGFDWQTFWDVTTPFEAARTLESMYGQCAKLAAAGNVKTAHQQSRDADREFWLAVLCRINGIDLDDHFARRSGR